MRLWLGRVGKLNEEETRNIAIWLSRYCAHPSKTLETVQGVFKAAKEAAKERARQEREARLAERESRTTAGGRGQQTTNNSHSPSRARIPFPGQAVSEPVAHPATKIFSLLGLIILTGLVTYIGRAVTFSTDILGMIFFVFTLLSGWYLSICNEIQFLVLGRVSLKALFIHMVIFVVAIIPAIIIYFITLLIMPWIAVAWVGGTAGVIIGSISRSIVRGLGTSEEYEGMSFARFGGLAKLVLGLSLLGIILGIGLGGMPQIGEFNFGNKDGETNPISSRCNAILARYAQGVTVGEIEAIIGKPPSIARTEGFGTAAIIWDYDDIDVYVMSDDLNKRSFALAVECVEPDSDSE
ncbi:hypothetical protein GlitD10_0683 [Gloeomargarita lithophora Alchichica-D10]|uniref:Uncharacterized protein n=1 Tax=Gloeomargarita lithophora Alchichica-D10 TaxID=1188229 RepID=A0A1J0AAQ9_9CYAN|nr:hypothetical protein [Gloeomargarita lithophora]APB32997.1 hypothetical protein GlitD10_0683 [Gloeomargarita lithophora Alchichica-D10]